MDAAERRLARVAAHLVPSFPVPHATVPPLTPSPTSSSSSSSAGDSYRHVHGDVPSEPPEWRAATDESGKEFVDIINEKAIGEGIAKITINRPDRRNAFRPLTVKELMRAFTGFHHFYRKVVVIINNENIRQFLQVQIRRLSKPVIAMVAGYAVGGGHVLHMVCDLTIAADNAIFGQTGPKVGPKRAREMWFLSRFYTADEADKMGLVNTVVPELGGNATLIFYGTEEAKEGKNAYMERRRPDFSKFPRKP
ncbi:unnamed protein product [Miscanthus lutarioriparius]|uniref:Uncharacterized protein n=1 Tax=Miscanthus lutarioriparius TaxID=422564 RepID=A0A811P4X5_9POAL|nr:unnamed protein product [Miscanthus lutarioriparius]